MKVALVQLHCHEDSWKPDAIPTYLRAAATDADLVVFPECLPFCSNPPPSIEDAKTKLIKVSKGFEEVAFLAGGYVRDGKKRRNAVFLVHDGQIKDMYFKRIRWKDEKLDPGEGSACFRWDGFSCIPLICADAGDNPSPTGTRMMYDALRLGAGEDTPIIVCSYGGGLRTPYWHRPLHAWSAGCGAPVAICGFAGKDKLTYEDGNGVTCNFGGGGSGAFWPDGDRSDQPTNRCIYIVDLDTRETENRQLPCVIE